MESGVFQVSAVHQRKPVLHLQKQGFVAVRLVHHGHLILFEGNSYRMEHALMKQTARQPQKEDNGDVR